MQYEETGNGIIKVRGGRPKLPDHLKAVSPNWSLKKGFIQKVTRMAIATGAESVSAFVREALEEKMAKTEKELHEK